MDHAWVLRARAAGERASAALETDAWPFSADWNRWLHPVDLVIPVLPRDWYVVDQLGTGV